MTETSDDGGNPLHDPAGNPVGLIGKTLGRYHIKAELGRGGMATVYRASDSQLGRDVAIKVMHGTFAGRGDIEKRFRREAQAVAAIKHDSILDIFDFAPGARGEPGYIVTEIIDGPTLRQLMEDCGGRIVPEVAALLAARVASALGAAHRHGIVHRDVKPDNVMIDRRPGAAVRVVLTDFGVAHIVADDTMTATGSLLGSPAYMSPEQARGQDVGPQSDVFSLGALLFHLVTGRTPFQGKDPLTMIAAIVHGELQRPSQLDAHVSGALEVVILRCLSRSAVERYPDANAVLAALRPLAEEAGLGDEPAALRAFVDDRETFLRGLKARVSEQAFASAKRCARRGELTRALAEVNRVFAYCPKHGGAETLLGTIASRRRWTKVAAIAGAAALVVAGGVGVSRLVRRESTPPSTPPVAVVAPAPAAPTKPMAIEAAPPAEPTPPAEAPPIPPAVIDPAPSNKASNPRRQRARARPAVEKSPAPAGAIPTATPAAAAFPPPAAPAALPPPASATPSPPPPPAAAVATASLTIRASQGFCSPSMDDHPAKIRPMYEGVTPGVHRIFCTLPGGEKRLVGTYELRAGTRPNLAIVPGPDGKPVLARPE